MDFTPINVHYPNTIPRLLHVTHPTVFQKLKGGLGTGFISVSRCKGREINTQLQATEVDFPKP
jgi:hypothetical protein